MSSAITTTTRRGPAMTAGHLAPRSRKPAMRLALWVVAAWSVPLVSYLLHVSWVVPPLVLLAAASLIRSGRSLLDRVIPAAALLYGSVCVAGLLLSVWPWHLHPVPIGGIALTALVVFAHRTRRRPSLPRPALTDGLSLAAAGFVGFVLAIPPLLRGEVVQISLLTMGEDGIRHFIQFDTIRELGGYLFLNGEVHQAGMAHYPQGWHLFFGLIDGFVRSSTEGSGLSALHHYLAYAALTYAAFALAVIWGLQRLAEPLLTPARRLALVAVGVAYVLSNETFSLAQLHFTPQIAGLAIVVVLVVMMARPPARTTLSLWLVAALLVGLGFTYTLYVPPMILAVLGWLYARRRHVVRHRFVLAATLVAMLFSAAPLLVGLVVAGQGRGLPAPTTTMGSVDGALLLAGIVAAGMLRSWRTGRWRVLRWTLASAVACLVGLYVLLWVQTGGGGSYYYANKLHNLVVLLLVLAVSAILGLLPAPQRVSTSWSWRDTGTWPAALRRLAPGISISLALAAGSGLVVGDSPYAANGAVNARGWVSGAVLQNIPLFLPQVAQSEVRRDVAPETITVVMCEDPPLAYLGQVLVSGLRRQYRDFLPSLYDTPYTHPDFYDNIIENLPPGPVLIVVDTERIRLVAEQLRARHSDRSITVAFINFSW